MSPRPRRPSVVLSCEHATARVPARWRRALQAALPADAWRAFVAALASHRGVDFGALGLAQAVAAALGQGQGTVPAVLAARHSRLLVDCNRSPHHQQRLSNFTRALPAALQRQLVAEAYAPHHAAVRAAVAAGLAQRGQVVHLGLHSFTPALNGQVRALDVGLLYDPARAAERNMATAVLDHLRAQAPALKLRLRRNAPYRGVADGMTTLLRRAYAEGAYVGLEIECNQAIVTTQPARWRALKAALAAAVAHVVRKNF